MKKHLTISKLMMLIVMAILPFSMYAQEEGKKEGKKQSKPTERYWYIQADGGLSINHGDLASYNGGIWDDWKHFQTSSFQNFGKSWNAHLGFGYQFSKVATCLTSMVMLLVQTRTMCMLVPSTTLPST